jgi:hypothetical protein
VYKWIRNTHLAFGVAFFLMAVLFVFSSVVIIYRPVFPRERQETEATISLRQNATARDAALDLMRDHGFRGDLRNIKTGDTTTFDINRPGTQVMVEYLPASGEAKIKTRRYNFFETLVQLHVNHGFWHDYFATNAWALLSLCASIGLILLGATGIYLWWRLGTDRTIGFILIAVGFLMPAAALIVTRVQG